MRDIKDIELLVSESGNSFHCKVTNYLRDKGWYTLVSPYYMDNATSKPREIDLIAEKAWTYEDRLERKFGAVIIKLFIECKYIPQANVFWFSDKDVVSAKQWVITNTPLRENNIFTDKHHYLNNDPKVAKLFASKNMPNVENEVVYKALNQSLNAMIYLRDRQSISPEFLKKRIPILATVEMPVILCNSFSDFYRVEMEDPGSPRPIDTNFQLEVNYAYLDRQRRNRTEYFLIDIIEFDKLDNFFNVLEEDIEAIFHLL